ILNSSEFKDSKRYQELLKYLVEKSDKEESTKEIGIAIDIFGKDANFDPNSNSQIRAYVSNLRKKLEHYYFTTEDLYTYKLEIPRGQYTVKYVHVDSVNGKHNFRKHLNYIYLAAIVLLITFLVYREIDTAYFANENFSLIPNSNPVWSEFLQKSSKPTTIVLGDYLFITEKNNPADRIFLRNTKINSEKDLQEFKKKKPDIYSNYELLKFTYIRPSAPYGLLEVLNIWNNSFKNLSIKLASQLKWEDFDEHNVIFIGTFKTLYKLDTLLVKTNLRYNVEPSSLTIVNSNRDTVESFKVNWQASNYQDDYSAVIKMPGSKNNSILFCLGFSEIGVLEAVKTAADPNFIPRMEKYAQRDISQNPLFFEFVSHLEGVELTAFRTEIKYFNIFDVNK
ncbi:MAG: hypothetical protein A2068_13705, partial [Ignavibacteria bacterium GWB2_35_6b]